MALANIAGVYHIHGDYENALTKYNQALSLNPKFSRAYNNIGDIYMQNKNYLKAEEFLEKGVSVDPQNISLRLNLAEVKFVNGHYNHTLELARIAKTIATNIRHKIISNYYEFLALLLLGQNTKQSEGELDSLIKETPNLSGNIWDSSSIYYWLNKANIPDETKQVIVEKTKKIEQLFNVKGKIHEGFHLHN